MIRGGVPRSPGCPPRSVPYAPATPFSGLPVGGFRVPVTHGGEADEKNLHFLYKVSQARRKELGEGGFCDGVLAMPNTMATATDGAAQRIRARFQACFQGWLPVRISIVHATDEADTLRRVDAERSARANGVFPVNGGLRHQLWQPFRRWIHRVRRTERRSRGKQSAFSLQGQPCSPEGTG